jgi:glycine oxidase
MNAPGPLTELCFASRAMFPKLQQELLELTGIDIELNHSGLLKVAMNEQEAKHLQRGGEWQSKLGQQAQWLSTRELSQLEPDLSSHNMMGALYLPEDVQVSAPRLTQALARAAQRLGVEIYEGYEVVQLKREGKRVTQVVTNREVWSVDWIIIAAGAWSGWLAEQVNLEIPVYPLKGESLAIQPQRPLIQKTIFTEQVYLVPKANGEIIVGATEKPYEMGSDVSAEAVQQLLSRAIQLIPDLAFGKLERFWASVRPASGDGKPIIGVPSHFSNLLIASGHQRNGILLSPITGELTVQMILGHKPAIIEPFHPDRFLPPVRKEGFK